MNTADIVAFEPESTANNNFTNFILGVERMSDLTVALTATADLVASATPITYTLYASNTGPSQDTGVSLEITLPLAHLGSGATVEGADCLQEFNGTVTTLLCDFGTLEANTEQIITISGTLAWLSAEPFTVTAAISGANAEPEADMPNAASLSTLVTPQQIMLPLILN